MRYQHYVNAIAYEDLRTARRTILLPVFPAAQTPDDQRIIQRNSATLASLGYRVVHVPSTTDELRGGIHCLVNVLE